MRKNLKIVVTIMIMIISTCAANAQQTETIFSDHFDGTRVNGLTWYIPTWRNPWDGTYVGRTQFRCSQNASLPIAENSNAVVNIETYNPTGYSLYGTDLISNRQFSPGKGLIITVRAKINAPVERGIVGGIFLYDLTNGYNHDEIDFELVSNDPSRIHTNIYANEALGTGYPGATDYVSSSITDYHTYVIEWLPNKVSWKVDGNIIRTNTDRVPLGPMSFHFNMWAPAQEWMDAFDASLQPTNWILENKVYSMLIDYIKVDSLSDNPRLPVSVTIAANQNNICAGEPVTFTATATNGGTAPSCQWKLNGNNVGFISMTYGSANLKNGDVVSCVMTSSLANVIGNPATSNSITMVVNERLPVSVSIAANQNPICSGQSVIFTATPTNGGTDPIYRWKVNGNDVGIDSSRYAYAPVNGDIVSCTMISTIDCYTNNPALSNSITMEVGQNLVVGVSISADQNDICEGMSVTYTATPVNGGTTPIYRWKVNKNSIETYSNTYSYVPANGDVVSCTMISSVNCLSGGNVVTSNSITMVVNKKLPVSVNIVADQNPVCTGMTVTYTATPTNGGSTPIYQWKRNGFNVGDNSNTYSYAVVNSDVVSCLLTSSNTCVIDNPVTSNSISMLVNQKLTVGISITASDNPVCDGSEVKFTANSVNGGTNPIYQWIKNGEKVGTNSGAYSYVTANGDEISCTLTSSENCVQNSPATSNTITMDVNPNLVIDVNIVSDQDNVCKGSTASFTATAVNVTNPTYQWKLNGENVGINSGRYYAVSPNDGDLISCLLTSNNACIVGDHFKESNRIKVEVNSAPVFDKLMGPDSININNTKTSDYTVYSIGNVDYYGWVISPSNAAGFVSVEDTTVKVRWNESFQGNCILTAKAVNVCGVAEIQKTIYVGTPTSVDELGEGADISIYPNPSSGIFTVDCDEAISRVCLYDINGRLMKKLDYQSLEKQVNVESNLHKGVYFVHVFMTKGYAIQKLIIN